MNYLQKEIFALLEQDEYLADYLLNKANQGLSLLDLKNNRQEWVQANLWSYLGVEKPTTQTPLLEAITQPSDQTQWQNFLQAQINSKKTHFEYDFCFEPQPHQEVHLRAVCRLFYDENEQATRLLRIFFTSKDTHSPRYLDLLEYFINQSQDAIQVSDTEGNLVYLNQEAAQRLNISPEEIHHYQVLDFEPIFQNQQQWQAHVEELKQNEKVIVQSQNYSHKDKKNIPVEVVVTYREIEGSGYVIAISRDVSERMEARRQLELQKKYLETLINYFPNGSISLIDANLNILLTGGEGYRLHQLDPNTFIGKSLIEILEPIVYQTTHEKLAALKSGATTSYEVKTLDRYYLNTIQDFFDAESQIDAYVLLVQDITQRKNDEFQLLQKNQELKASEEELRRANQELIQAKKILEDQKAQLLLIFEAANLGTWDWDMSTDYTVYNEQWAIMLGYDPASIQPHADSFLSLLHPDDSERMKQILSNQQEGKIIAFEEEIRMKAKSGEWRWILDTGKVVLIEGKEGNRRAIGVHQDITDRKRYEQRILQANQELRVSEEELKASEEELKAYIEELSEAKLAIEAQKEKLLMVFEAANLGAWDWDMAENRTTYNKQWLQLMEFEEDLTSWQLTDEEFFEKVHPEDRAKMIEITYQFLTGAREYFQEEYRMKTNKGNVKWILNTGKVIQKSKQGTPLRAIGVYQDISLRKESEIALQKLQENALKVAKQYQDILDSQTVFVLKTDLAGNYTYINDYFYEKFGYQGFQIGDSSLESIIPEDRQQCINVVMKCFAEPDTPHEVILRKIDKEGLIKGSKWEFRGLVDKIGGVQEILCVGFDITEQLESIEKIQTLLDISSEQNTKLKSFAYIVSHNVRSHAANFTGLLVLIKETESEQEKALYFTMLETCAKQLDETIYNLNEIVSINENLAKPKDPRNLKKEVLKTLDILAGEVMQHKVEIRLNIEEELNLKVIPAYLESILLNLISNAIKYRSLQNPPYIEISAQRIAKYVCLYVKDNGQGIDLERHRSKLFGMYKTFHTNPDARGFGLYITKTQIEAMRGKIEVESEVNVGTTFKVFFYDAH